MGAGYGMARAASVLAHIGIPGPGPFVAVGLFFAGAGAGVGVGAYALLHSPARPDRRATGIALAVVAFGCFAAATLMPLFLHASLGITRPSTAARLEILSPRPNEAFSGNPVFFGAHCTPPSTLFATPRLESP